MSQLAQAANPAPAANREQRRHPNVPSRGHEGRDELHQRRVREWNTMPTLVGIPAVQAFARDELGVELSKTLLRNATEQRRIEVFKVSARNAYSEAGVVRFIESLARPVMGGDQR